MFGPKLYSPPVAFHFSVRIVDTPGTKTPTKAPGKLESLGKMAIDKGLAAAGLLPEVDGRFQEVSGFSATLEVEEIKEAGNNNETIKLPGRITYSPLVMKRGLVIMKTQFGEWFKGILNNNYKGQIPRRNIVVSLINENNVPLMTWTFEKAFPVKWELSAMNAMDNQLSFETIELAYSRLIIGEDMYESAKKDPLGTAGAILKGSIKF